MWVIISLVTATVFGANPHEFSSNRHFDTEQACHDYMQRDAEELLLEIDSVYGEQDNMHLEAHCEIDGEPA
jgi:hypothetical protein